jgi:hypothetical protein
MKRALIIPTAIVLLILLAFATTNAYRVATLKVSFVEERPEAARTVEYVVSGLKCRGTAMGLARVIAPVEGVVSLTSYARTHTAIVEYDPNLTDVDAIAAAMTAPIVHEGQTYEVFQVVSKRDLD